MLFSKVHKLTTDRRTDDRRDGQTDGWVVYRTNAKYNFEKSTFSGRAIEKQNDVILDITFKALYYLDSD